MSTHGNNGARTYHYLVTLSDDIGINSTSVSLNYSTPLDQACALRRAKFQALGLLLLVTAVFIATSVVERGLWLNAVKAMAEAAMVGALADWFAVVALFRRPLGLPIPHTAVIARNQARIGRNLATFVRDKFLDVPSLVSLIRRHDPAERLAQWLTSPGNAALLGHQATRLASAALETVQDAQVERFIHKAARALIGQVDMSRALAAVLDTLTHNGRHQALLDDVLAKLIELLQNEQTRHAATPFMRDLEAMFRRFAPAYDRLGHVGANRDAKLVAFFRHGHRHVALAHHHAIDRAGLDDYLASVSYLPAAGHPDHPALVAAAVALIAAHPAPLALSYVTDVYLAPLPA